MLTCKSPRKVLLVAYEAAGRCMRNYSSKYSRHDFTRPQLFACLVLREQQNKTYRGIEALLCDCEHWCKQIGMRKAPDHNTLCRAFHALLSDARIDRLLDLLTQWMAMEKALGKICSVDSTLYDTHHHSRHYEQRCRHYASRDKNTANSRRSRSARPTPKLSLSIDIRSHLILAAKARTGMGADS